MCSSLQGTELEAGRHQGNARQPCCEMQAQGVLPELGQLPLLPLQLALHHDHKPHFLRSTPPAVRGLFQPVSLGGKCRCRNVAHSKGVEGVKGRKRQRGGAQGSPLCTLPELCVTFLQMQNKVECHKRFCHAKTSGVLGREPWTTHCSLDHIHVSPRHKHFIEQCVFFPAALTVFWQCLWAWLCFLWIFSPLIGCCPDVMNSGPAIPHKLRGAFAHCISTPSKLLSFLHLWLQPYEASRTPFPCVSFCTLLPPF